MPSSRPTDEDLAAGTQRELAEVRLLVEELNKLRLTDPGSPRLKTLENQIVPILDSVKSQTGRLREEMHKRSEIVDRAERLSFDLQKQMTPLSATLIVALLALSGVFKGTEGLRAAVGDASSAFAYSVAASVLAMLLSTMYEFDWSLLRAPSDAPRTKRGESQGQPLGWNSVLIALPLSVATLIAVSLLTGGNRSGRLASEIAEARDRVS